MECDIHYRGIVLSPHNSYSTRLYHRWSVGMWVQYTIKDIRNSPLSAKPISIVYRCPASAQCSLLSHWRIQGGGGKPSRAPQKPRRGPIYHLPPPPKKKRQTKVASGAWQIGNGRRKKILTLLWPKNAKYRACGAAKPLPVPYSWSSGLAVA